MTANITVNVPSTITKPWIIRNAITAASTIEIIFRYSASGTNYAEIFTGRTAKVFGDGTGMYNINANNASTVTNGVYTTDTGTVTSTMILDGTIVNGDISASAAIAISKLAASTISGISLGNNLGTLTIGSGLSGTSYNGSAGVTIAIDSSVALRADTHYIGTTGVALNRASGNLALTGISSVTLPGSTSGTVTLQPAATAGVTTITLPATSGTVVTTGDTGTVTNAMLAGSIANNKLSNSTISGISLGSNLNTLTIGSGLSGNLYNGSTAVTIAVDSTVALRADTHYIGTTAITLNRASAAQTLTGVNIDGNSGTVGGLAVASARNNLANQVVRTDGSGYLQCGYINSSNGNEGNNSNPARVWGTNGSDDYLRTYLTSALSVSYAASSGSCSGNAATATTATYLSATQQTNVILCKSSSLAMIANDSSSNGSIIHRASGTGDGNLAGETFWQDSYAIKLGVRNDGYFGLGGWSRAAWSWYSDPSGNMTAAGNVTAYSDPRLKEKFQKISNPFDILLNLDGGTFFWKSGIPHTQSKAGTKDYGILADQVEQVMPEIVSDSIDLDGEVYKTVCYEKLVPVLIEAIKELKREVDDLKSQLGK
jgi:uncharacterized protein YunC (DUF1805 family)